MSPTIPGRLTINERTTVATGYAMAQFLDSTSIAGRAPGVRGAAMMAANLADPVSGRLGTTLTSPPNGSATSTLGAFISLTNALAACTSGADGCGALRSATTTPLSGRPANLQPPHNSMSKFSPQGQALSPASGFTRGAMDWPQGMTTDRNGSIWRPTARRAL